MWSYYVNIFGIPAETLSSVPEAYIYVYGFFCLALLFAMGWFILSIFKR